MISNQNIGAAYPADLSDPNLTDWIIYDKLAIQQTEGQGRAGEFRDAHIWKEGDSWCMLVCTGSMKSEGGSAILYETKTLEVKPDGTIDMDWKYRGLVYEMENQPMTYGTSWELPILMPLTNEAGTITKYIFMISPAPAGLADNKVYYFWVILAWRLESLHQMRTLITIHHYLIMDVMFLLDQVYLWTHRAVMYVCLALCRIKGQARRKVLLGGHIVLV